MPKNHLTYDKKTDPDNILLPGSVFVISANTLGKQGTADPTCKICVFLAGHHPKPFNNFSEIGFAPLELKHTLLSCTIFNRDHMRALMISVKVISAAIKDIAILGIHLHDHVSILTLGTLENIVFMNLVICHKIANFRLIGTNPKIQAVVFIKLIF